MMSWGWDSQVQKPAPYIGITGITTAAEAEATAAAFAFATGADDSALQRSRALHQAAFGYCVDARMIAGGPRPNLRYVQMEQFAAACRVAAPHGINVVHFLVEEPTLARVVEPLIVLFRMNDIYADNLCRTVQLNNKAIAVELVEALRSELPELRIIYQLQSSVLNGRTHEEVVDFLAPYVPLISYILVDRSAGLGVPFDPVEAAVLLQKVRTAYPALGLGVTGGFSPANVAERLHYLREEIGADFSIDVETKVRRKRSDAQWDDVLDAGKVGDFLEQAFGVF